MQYLPGKPIIGFWGLFEADYGNPKTPTPYVRVTPSAEGRQLLPFRCPACKESLHEFCHPVSREHYHDTRKISLNERLAIRRNNYWCPVCGFRFYLKLSGMPHTGGEYPASKVEAFGVKNGKITLIGAITQDGPGLLARIRNWFRG